MLATLDHYMLASSGVSTTITHSFPNTGTIICTRIGHYSRNPSEVKPNDEMIKQLFQCNVTYIGRTMIGHESVSHIGRLTRALVRTASILGFNHT